MTFLPQTNIADAESPPAEPVHYDHVVVGGGIISILRAIDAARTGQRVALIEAEQQLGGAWRVFELPGFGATELGPHVLRYHKEAYRFVEENLCALETLAPEPIWLLHRPVLGLRKFPFKYTWVRDMLLLRDGLISRPSLTKQEREANRINKLDERQRLGASAAARRLLNLALGAAYEKYRVRPVIKYFRNGTTELLSRLTEDLSQCGVDVHFNTRVKTIRIADSSITLDAGLRTYECGGLYLTTGVGLQFVEVGDRRYELQRNVLRYRQVFLCVYCSTKRFTYVEVIDHPQIKRIFDITEYTERGNGANSGRRLITATIIGSDDDDRSLCEELIAYLAKCRILKKRVDWELVAANTYSVNLYKSDEAEALINADYRCTMERTTDMSLALKQCFERAEVR